MDDVAREAGVSKITVSRVFRNHPYVGEEMRARVSGAARRLGYLPNPLVHALMSQVRQRRVKSEGVVLGLLNPLGRPLALHESERVRGIWAGMQQQAERSGYRIEEFDTGPAGLSVERCNRILRARGITGLIIMFFREGEAGIQLDWDRLASATIGFSLREPRIHRAVPDHYHNARLLAAELISRKFERPALVVDTNSAVRTDHLWEAGLSRWSALQPLEEKVPVFMEEDLYSQKAQARLAVWLRKQKPDVVISNHDFVPAFMEGLHLRWRPAFAQLDLSRESGMAGIDQNFPAVGAAAVDMISGQLMRNESGIPTIPKTVLIPGEFRAGSLRAAGAR